MMVNATGDRKIRNVLDIGCGAGQEMLPFAEKKNCLCVGIDIGQEVGAVGQQLFRQAGHVEKAVFLRCSGEQLAFDESTFDVVICRLALPYMDNRETIKEISRVLSPGGLFFLKIHAPAFYLWMLKERLPSFSLKRLAYPLICLACGTVNMITGRHPKGRFWDGKEIFQTERLLKKELAKNNLRITKNLSDTNFATPSFLIEKFI